MTPISFLGIEFKLFSTYHPQTDGQSEVVNKMSRDLSSVYVWGETERLECLVTKCGVGYNTNFHTSARMTTYEIVYNWSPPLHLPYLPEQSSNEALDRTLQRKEEMITRLKYNLRGLNTGWSNKMIFIGQMGFLK